MAKYTGPVCRLCRRERTKLFLKGSRCFDSNKCAVDKRSYEPGMFGARGRFGRKQTDYGVQLRERQKARRMYGVLEKQFRRLVQEAVNMRGVAGENMFRLLESRLDNVVFRLGFAVSRAQARQLVRHGHLTLNGRRVDIPSHEVKVNDTVAIAEESRELAVIVDAMQVSAASGLPPWVVRDDAGFSGSLTRLPRPEEIGAPVDPQQIIELYSR
ncbi:30S ribosomal protein S4 [bacterium]|nr:30S ribosomal protein S4 [bacterium]